MGTTHTANSATFMPLNQGDGARNFNPLEGGYRVLFSEALRLGLKDTRLPLFLIRTLRAQRKALRVRAGFAAQGLSVPPVIVVSVTNRCNLRCNGRYHHALRDLSGPEMSGEKLHSVIGEARQLGISLVVFVGGEPLVRPVVMQIAHDFPEMIFLIFTNGTLITDEMIKRFRRQRNIVPILSIEGYQNETDSRRGRGIYEGLQNVIARLRNRGVFFGASVTVTKQTFHAVVNDSFVKQITGKGCKFVLFSEYTPTEPGTEDWVISDTQRDILAADVQRYRSSMSALFFSAPGDERRFGGCLSAGRGFIHVNAQGDVEPCPFIPFSDVNLERSSLEEALRSQFLKAVRISGVEGGRGGCALWEKRDSVRSLLRERSSTQKLPRPVPVYSAVSSRHGTYYRIHIAA